RCPRVLLVGEGTAARGPGTPGRCAPSLRRVGRVRLYGIRPCPQPRDLHNPCSPTARSAYRGPSPPPPAVVPGARGPCCPAARGVSLSPLLALPRHSLCLPASSLPTVDYCIVTMVIVIFGS